MAYLTQLLREKYLKWEGGYQCYTNDVANYNSLHQLVGTNYGVGALTYEDYIGHPPTKEEMQNMPSDVPTQIMKKYWHIIEGDILTSQSVAELILDWFWASGYTGIKWFQGVLQVRLGLKLTVDYRFEMWEALEVNKQDSKKVFDILKEERLKYTDYIIKQSISRYKIKCKSENYKPTTADMINNTYRKFEHGWKDRINSYKFTD
jgi:hypothetical protein